MSGTIGECEGFSKRQLLLLVARTVQAQGAGHAEQRAVDVMVCVCVFPPSRYVCEAGGMNE